MRSCATRRSRATSRSARRWPATCAAAPATRAWFALSGNLVHLTCEGVRRRSPYDREILALALPALGALAAEPLYVLVDTAIVGHLGTSQLAALALAGT